MAEFEELRLHVVLIDEASAGLLRLRQSIQGINNTDLDKTLQKIGQETEALGRKMRPLHEQAEKTSNAVKFLSNTVTSAITALATAFISNFAIDSLRKFTDEMVKLDATARQIGVDSANIRSVVEQMKLMGVEGGAATSMVQQFAGAIAELGKQGSEVRQKWMQGAALAGRTDQMRAFIERLTGFGNSGDLASAMNELRSGAEAIFEGALKEGRSKIEAGSIRDNFLKEGGFDPTV